jgi:thymidylate kinase
MNYSDDILKLAARLSNPWTDEPLPAIPEEDLAAVLSVLKKNGASLLHLENKPGWGNGDSPLLPYIQAERAELDRLRAEFERVRLAFQEDGINTLFIKSTGLFPSFPHLSSNLDVMVPAERGDEARQRLISLGYIELLNAEEPKKFLFRRFKYGELSFTFHLHELVGWGVPFLDTDPIWQGAQPAPDDPDIRIPGPVEALLITLAHWFYEDKELSLRNLYLTANALKNLPAGLNSAVQSAADRGWEAGFYAALEIFDESWRRLFGNPYLDIDIKEILRSGLEKESFLRSSILNKVRYLEGYPAVIPFLANKVVYYRKVLADKRRPVGTRMKDVFITLMGAVRLKTRVRSQKPMLISISGCDGSGKTVQAELLKTAFATCALRNRLVWSRGGSSRFMSVFIRTAKRLFSRGSSGKTGGGSGSVDAALIEAEKIRSRRESLRHPVLRLLYSVLYSLDLAAEYWIKARFYLLTGNLVIYDRYLPDALVDLATAGGGRPEQAPFAFKLLGWLAPRPQLMFFLDVDEAEALRRKPEEGDTGHLAEARRMFLAIAEQRGGTVVASGQGLESVHEKIVFNSLRAYYKRHRTVRNWLLYANPNQLNPGRWRG